MVGPWTTSVAQEVHVASTRLFALVQRCHERWRHTPLESSETSNRNGDLPMDLPNMMDSEYNGLLVGGLVAIFYFPIYWVANHPN